MNLDRIIFAIAGGFVLISLALSQIHSHYWLWFTALIGANLFQAAFTGFCPTVKLLKTLGVKPGRAFE